MLSLIGEMGITNGGQNGLMAQDFLNLDQINAGLNQIFFLRRRTVRLCPVLFESRHDLAVFWRCMHLSNRRGDWET